jgi:twitching motility protein PilT
MEPSIIPVSVIELKTPPQYFEKVVKIKGLSDVALRSNGQSGYVANGKYIRDPEADSISFDSFLDFIWSGVDFGVSDGGVDSQIQAKSKNLNTPYLAEYMRKHCRWEEAVSLLNERYRVELVRHHFGLEVVLRLLPKTIPSAEQILLEHTVIEKFNELKYGLVLVGGSVNSGKSTTIASLILQRAQQKSERYCLLEDPLEFIFPLNLESGSVFNQRQVGGKHCETFSLGLRDALRLSPRVIGMGEIRDADTAEAAIAAAQTGHVVVATIHASTGHELLPRLLNLFPADRERSMRDAISDAFKIGVVQRFHIHPLEGNRVVLRETVFATHGVKASIREGAFDQIKQTIELGTRDGMQTFERALKVRVDEGHLPASVLYEIN